MKTPPLKMCDTLPDVKGQALYALCERAKRIMLNPLDMVRHPGGIVVVAQAALAILKTSKIKEEFDSIVARVSEDGREMLGEGKIMLEALFVLVKKGWQQVEDEVARAGGFSMDHPVQKSDAGDGNMGNLADADDGDTSGVWLPDMPDDSVALSGDFAGWSERFRNSLAERWPLGFPVVDREDKHAYQIGWASNDDPLFTTDGFRRYYGSSEVA